MTILDEKKNKIKINYKETKFYSKFHIVLKLTIVCRLQPPMFCKLDPSNYAWLYISYL